MSSGPDLYPKSGLKLETRFLFKIRWVDPDNCINMPNTSEGKRQAKPPGPCRGELYSPDYSYRLQLRWWRLHCKELWFVLQFHTLTGYKITQSYQWGQSIRLMESQSLGKGLGGSTRFKNSPMRGYQIFTSHSTEKNLLGWHIKNIPTDICTLWDNVITVLIGDIVL